MRWKIDTMGDTVKGSGAPGFSSPGGFCVFQDGIQVQSAQIQVVIERKLRYVGREGVTGCQDSEMDQTGDEKPPKHTPGGAAPLFKPHQRTLVVPCSAPRHLIYPGSENDLTALLQKCHFTPHC